MASYNATFSATNGIAFIANESLRWPWPATTGTGNFRANVTSPSVGIRFENTGGPLPQVGDVVHGLTSGAERTLSGWFQIPVYDVTFGATNGIAFTAWETVSWPGGAGTGDGTFVANLSTDGIRFTHTNAGVGPAPQVGDIIHGDTSGAERTITEFRSHSVGLKLEAYRLSVPTNVSAAMWTTRLLKVGQVVGGRFRVNFVFLNNSNGASGGTFVTNCASFGVTNQTPGQYTGFTIAQGLNIGWGTQTHLFSRADFTNVFLWDNSAGDFFDLTNPAKESDPATFTHLHESADILYLGFTEPRISPGISYERSSQGGGGPLVCRYSNTSSGWSSPSGFVDGTSAFTAKGMIDMTRPDDWGQVTINAQTRYWLELRLSANAATGAVGSWLKAHRRLDGVSGALLSQNTDPYWRHYFIDIDGLAGTGVSIVNATFPPEGTLVRWLARKVGTVTYPAGTLFRTATLGVEHALLNATDGNGYTKWELWNEFGGFWRTVGTFFIPTELYPSLSPTLPFHPFTEWPSRAPGSQLLAENPNDIRYSGMRVMDENGAWHEMTEWRNNFSHPTPELDYGYSAQATIGEIASLTEDTSYYCDNAVGKYLFAGLEYENGTTGSALATAGLASAIAIGSTTINGPRWGASKPYVIQEHDRGYLVLAPSTANKVRAVFVAKATGSHRFVGDFAFISDSASGGNGADVSVVRADGNVTLFSATIPAANGNATNPFDSSSTHKPFDVTVSLVAGEKVWFIVDAKGAQSFDETAFRVSPRFTPTDADRWWATCPRLDAAALPGTYESVTYTETGSLVARVVSFSWDDAQLDKRAALLLLDRLTEKLVARLSMSSY